MTRFVIDPPTLVRLAGYRGRVDTAHRLVAPNSIRSQALDLLLQEVRSGRLSEHAALELHEAMTELKMRLLGDRVSRRTAWRIAVEHDWSTIQDAEYLAVAKLQADALVTVDPEMAAKAAGVVPVAPLTDVLVA
jgi:predicted nucleic acid-binding protein